MLLEILQVWSQWIRFPSQEKFPDLSRKWIEFVNDPDFKPSVYSRICIENFGGKYIKSGKRIHLIRDNLPIPIIYSLLCRSKN